MPVPWVDGTTPVNAANLEEMETDIATKQSVADKGSPNGYASLDGTGKVPAAQLPAAPAAPTAATVPSDPTGDVAANNVQAAIAELATEKQAVSQKGAASGYASLDAGSKVPVAQLPDLSGTYQVKSEKAQASGYASLGVDGKVPAAQLPAAPATPNAAAITSTATGDVAATNVQAAIAELASEKQAVSAKGAVNGYAGLDSGGTVPDAQIPAAIARDTEVTAAISAHAAAADPHTGYQKETEKGAAGGYASLDPSGLVPDAQIPAAIARDTEITAAVTAHEAAADPHTGYQKESEKAAASGYASLDAGTKVPVAQIPDLSGTYQIKSEKAQASGYASLDATGKVPAAQLPTAAGGVPAGSILDFGGNAAPAGYLLCDGASYLRATYPDLFTAIGVLWGAADGTHFNVPNLNGCVTVGYDAGQTEFDLVGEKGGAKTVTLTIAQIPSHSHGGLTGGAGSHKHSIQFSNGGGTINYGYTMARQSNTTSDVYDAFSLNSISDPGNHQHSITAEGGGTAHTNLQPYATVRKIIKT